MNKTIATVSAAVALGSTSLSAVTLPAYAELNVTSDITFASEHVSRGIERANESFQPSVEASFGDFYLGVWSNLPATNNQELTELNYVGGFSLYVPQWVGESFDIGATVYHFPDAGVQRTHEAYVGTQVDLPNIPGTSLAAYYRYDFDVRSHNIEGSIGYSFSLEQWVPQAASIDVSVLAGGQFGGDMKNHGIRPSEDYRYYGAKLEVPYYLNDFSNVTAGLHYETADNYTFRPGERGKNLFWTISYTAGF